MVDVSEIERRTELVKTASISVANPVGGVLPSSVAEVIKMAELYARSGVMVPVHCRDKIGTCYALCDQALTWGFPPLAVINQSYVVNNRGTERISYSSQMIHAVIEKNAPLKGRLRYEILGEGDERRCKVFGTFVGEVKPHEYTSETLAKLRDARGRNEAGQIKGSPLWETLPEVQMFYSASRQWARLFCPDVILGVYTPEEIQNEPIDVTPQVSGLAQRLKDAKAAHTETRGFDPSNVNTIIEGDANTGVDQKEAENENAKGSDAESGSGGTGRAGDDQRGDLQQGGSVDVEHGDQRSGGVPASDSEKPAQAEIFPPDREPKAKGKRK